MLREGRKEGKKDMKDNEKARSSTTECVLTTSIWRHQHRLSCCIHAPARYVLGIHETFATRVVRRVQQSAFLRRSRFVSCVGTKVHMNACLFDLGCLYVTYTNKNLGNERVTTFITDASSWNVCTFLQQDSVSNDPETFSYVMKIYERVCAHTKTSQIALQRVFLGSPQNSWTYSFKHADTHDGPGRTRKWSVCALGYDSVLSKHIQMLTPGLLTLLHVNIPCCLTSASISSEAWDVEWKWLYHTHSV
jgi:hypothetical protein